MLALLRLSRGSTYTILMIAALTLGSSAPSTVIKLLTYINILLSCKGRGGVTPFTVETVEAEVGKQGSVNAGG